MKPQNKGLVSLRPSKGPRKDNIQTLEHAILSDKSRLRVDLSGCPIDQNTFQLIRKASNIDTLILHERKIDRAWLPDLASNTSIRNLFIDGVDIRGDIREFLSNTTITRLGASCCNLQAEHISSLAQNTTITALDIGFNWVDPGCLKTLSSNGKIASLAINHTPLDAGHLAALDAGNTLERLDIIYCNVGAEGAKQLAEFNSPLKTLVLSTNSIGPEGARALALSTSITKLRVPDNGIWDEGAKALAENTIITNLDVGTNGLDLEGLVALAKNTHLRTLDVMDNDCDDEAIVALAANTCLTKLKVQADFGGRGFEALAANENLLFLALSGEIIYRSELEILARNQKLERLDMVNCDDCENVEPLLTNTVLQEITGPGEGYGKWLKIARHTERNRALRRRETKKVVQMLMILLRTRFCYVNLAKRRNQI